MAGTKTVMEASSEAIQNGEVEIETRRKNVDAMCLYYGAQLNDAGTELMVIGKEGDGIVLNYLRNDYEERLLRWLTAKNPLDRAAARLDLSFRELAQYVGRTPQAVQSWARYPDGGFLPSKESQIVLCNLFGITPAEWKELRMAHEGEEYTNAELATK